MIKVREKIEDRLKESGFKVTNKRVELLLALYDYGKPVSINDIHKKLSGAINIVTIYRALHDMAQLGLVKLINLSHEKAYYEYIDNDHHHHHIICERCDRIEELEDCDIEAYIKKSLKGSKNFKTIKNHNLEFYGICNECNKKNK